jgi:hypothetical protein
MTMGSLAGRMRLAWELPDEVLMGGLPRMAHALNRT